MEAKFNALHLCCSCLEKTLLLFHVHNTCLDHARPALVYQGVETSKSSVQRHHPTHTPHGRTWQRRDVCMHMCKSLGREKLYRRVVVNHIFTALLYVHAQMRSTLISFHLNALTSAWPLLSFSHLSLPLRMKKREMFSKKLPLSINLPIFGVSFPLLFHFPR